MKESEKLDYDLVKCFECWSRNCSDWTLQNLESRDNGVCLYVSESRMLKMSLITLSVCLSGVMVRQPQERHGTQWIFCFVKKGIKHLWFLSLLLWPKDKSNTPTCSQLDRSWNRTPGEMANHSIWRVSIPVHVILQGGGTLKSRHTEGFFEKHFTSFFFCCSFIAKDQPWRTRAHFERGGGFSEQKNNPDSRLIRHSSRERGGKFEKGAGPLMSRQCREFTVPSLWLLHHGGLARVPRVSTAAWSIKKKKSDSEITISWQHRRSWRPVVSSSPLPCDSSASGTSRGRLPSRLGAPPKSWQVGDVGEEALSPPLLQVDGHKVCTEASGKN